MSDAEDAARYRWLKAQFEQSIEQREWDELVSDDGKRKVYEIRTEFLSEFHFKDEWRLYEHAATREQIRDFDKLVDSLRNADTTAGEP